jgi:hypothetical protein
MKLIAKAALAIAVAFGAMSVGIASADAGCTNCKPASKTIVKTNTVYKNVHKHNRVTKYKDVKKTKYVNVVNRTVVVTRVIPVTHVHTITRVHNHTVYQHKKETVNKKVMAPVKYTYSASTVPGKSTSSKVSCGCK